MRIVPAMAIGGGLVLAVLPFRERQRRLAVLVQAVSGLLLVAFGLAVIPIIREGLGDFDPSRAYRLAGGLFIAYFVSAMLGGIASVRLRSIDVDGENPSREVEPSELG